MLFDTSVRIPWPAPQPPAEPVIERIFPLLTPMAGKNADTLYGSNRAAIVLDRDGRLVHCGRDLGGAVEALEKLLLAAG